MNLLGSEVERGELFDLQGVVGAPVRQVGGCQRRARAGKVLFGEELEELAVTGDGSFHHCDPSRLPQPLLLRSGNGGGERFERAPEDALGHVVDDVSGHGVVVAVERRTRHGHSTLEAHAHQRDLFPHIARPGLQPADVVLVVLHRGHRHLLRQAGKAGVEAGIGGEGNLIVAKVIGLERVLEALLEHVVIHDLGWRQLGTVDACQLGEHALRVLMAPLQVRRRDRRQTIVVFVPADGGGEGRTLAQACLPRPVEEIVQLRDVIGRKGRQGEESEGRNDRESPVQEAHEAGS